MGTIRSINAPGGSHRATCFHCDLVPILNAWREKHADYPMATILTDLLDTCAELIASGSADEDELLHHVLSLSLRMQLSARRAHETFKAQGLPTGRGRPPA